MGGGGTEPGAAGSSSVLCSSRVCSCDCTPSPSPGHPPPPGWLQLHLPGERVPELESEVVLR